MKNTKEHQVFEAITHLTKLDYQILCATEGTEFANHIMLINIALQKEDALGRKGRIIEN